MGAAVGRVLLALGHGRPGEWVEWALPGVVAILGVLQAFGATKGIGWAALVIVLLVVERVLARFRRGSALFQLLRRISRLNMSFAGSLDSVLAHLLRTPATRLGEDVSKALCVGLLARLRHYGELALNADTPLRATLAVPLRDSRGTVTALRVWCYDEPYHDRRWTTLEIGLEGAPAAYRKGSVQVIPDIRTVRGVENADQRPYRSVASIPVQAGGPCGSALAVVSLDAPEPEFFRERDIEQKLVPMIQPVVNTLAVVLALRQLGVPYEFGS